MSFTSEVKDEMAHVVPECGECEKSTLSALMRIEGSLHVGASAQYRIEIATDVSSVARLIIRLLHGLYDLKTELSIRRSVLHKTPNFLIEIPYQPSLRDALQDMGILFSQENLHQGIKGSLISKRCCAAAYLRGAFLASGFISHPKNDFHFEITVENEELAYGLSGLLREADIHARIMQRRSSFMVYLKSGNDIAEFLAFTGAHASMLFMEEQRVIKSVRNDVNRLINAEVANQNKTSEAAIRQILAIKRIIDCGGIEDLSPALQDFIRLRIANPDASLKELGELSRPPLSKSAIYHRVRRLEQIARHIANSQELC